MQQLRWAVVNYTNSNQAKCLKDGKWILPETVLADAAKQQGLDGAWLKDAWGQPLKLVKRDKKRDRPARASTQFEDYDIVSAGPDGKFDTADDVKLSAEPVNPWRLRPALVGRRRGARTRTARLRGATAATAT